MCLKNIFIGLLFILLPFYICSQIPDLEISDNFKQIMAISDGDQELINADIQGNSYLDFFEKFILISGEKANRDMYIDWFTEIEAIIENDLQEHFSSTDTLNFSFEKQMKFAEQLLIILHNKIFTRYIVTANTIREIKTKGEFNCVSSSILYSIFLKKYHIESSGVETKDHVFIKIIFGNEIVDVETTNKFGFAPGKKTDVLDNFGKVTGFAYVPPKDYKNRNDIDLKKLLFIVYQNLCNNYYLKKDYIKACNLAYIVYQGRYDARGKEVFESYFNNYIVGESRSKNYTVLIDDINSYINHLEWNDTFIRIRFELLYNYIGEWRDYKDREPMKHYLLTQNETFQNLKDHESFIETYFYFTYKSVEYAYKNKQFNDAYGIIRDFNERYTHKDIHVVFTNTLITEMNFYLDHDKYEKIEKKLTELKLDFPEYMDIIKENEKSYTINKINYQLTKKHYTDALNQAKNLLLTYPDDYQVNNVLKNCYVKYTIALFEEKKLEQLIRYCEEALKKFPDDRILLNNYLIFYKKIIKEEIDNKHYSQARKMVNQALTRFTNDAYLIKINKYLTSLNY